MKLRDYQQITVNQVLDSFKTYNKVLLQLPTGGGKTFTFCYLASIAKGKVHILVNRTELVEQTYNTLLNMGVPAAKITAKTKKIPDAKIYIGMVETVARRIKSGKIHANDITLAIIDECHRGEFDKLLPYYNNKILGCTATPTRLKRHSFYKCPICYESYNDNGMCCSQELNEWSKPFKMHEIYEHIVCGATVKELIGKGKLIPDSNFIFQPEDFDKLKTDNSGEYTENSLSKVYGNVDQIEILYNQYEQLAKGKKTIIFCSNTKTSKKVYEVFKNNGSNILSYDSVNGGNRKDIVSKFAQERNVILTNVNVFTTGFDVTDIECLIVYRATKSLALWQQMVGRGARPTQEIFKDKFIVIDFGQNIEIHGKWSDDIDWKNIFYKGYGKEKKKSDLENMWTCNSCGAFNTMDTDICEYCDEKKIKIVKTECPKSGKLVPVDPYPLPKTKPIIDYTIKMGKDRNFSHKILAEQILFLFKYYQIEKNDYIDRLDSYHKRIYQIIKPVYFGLLKNQQIQTKNNRKLKHVIDKTIEKINDYYENR